MIHDDDRSGNVRAANSTATPPATATKAFVLALNTQAFHLYRLRARLLLNNTNLRADVHQLDAESTV